MGEQPPSDKPIPNIPISAPGAVPPEPAEAAEAVPPVAGAASSERSARAMVTGPVPAFASAHAAALAIESVPVPDPAAPRAARPAAAPVSRRDRVKRRRVLIGDARRNGRYLRATWHPEDRMFVLSTWTDEVCSGAVRIPIDKAADLITLLADGLSDAVNPQHGPPEPRRAVSPQHHVDGVKAALFGWLRGRAAKATTVLRAREVAAEAKVHEHRRRTEP